MVKAKFCLSINIFYILSYGRIYLNDPFDDFGTCSNFTVLYNKKIYSTSMCNLSMLTADRLMTEASAVNISTQLIILQVPALMALMSTWIQVSQVIIVHHLTGTSTHDTHVHLDTGYSSSPYRYQHSWHSCPRGYRYHRFQLIILQVLYKHSWHSCPPGYRYHRSKFIILQVPEIMALMSTWTQASQVKGLTRQVSWVRISRMTCLRVRTKKGRSYEVRTNMNEFMDRALMTGRLG